MSSSNAIAQGTTIGEDFEIEGLLGEGGMGVVYAARQLTTGYPRAVKLMHSPFALDSRARARFEQESKICARIQSDHVVQVVASGVEKSTQTPWIAMELLQGRDLDRHLAASGPMPIADVATIVSQAGHALAAAHDVGVVHRDVKPENIFLSVSRVVGVPYMVKVLDFGIAKLRSSARGATAAIGTPAYMAPEQIVANDEIWPSADVWSLALVVFRMLTGKYYWLSENGSESGEGVMPTLWREVLIDPLPAASERAAELAVAERIPPGFDEWFAHCLDRDPSSRYRHARDAMKALDAVFRPLGHSVASSEPIPAEHRAPEPANSNFPSMLASLAPTEEKLRTGSRPSAKSIALSERASDSAPRPLHRVSFREHDERIVTTSEDGQRLLDISLAAGIPHYHACGGRARCSTCRVVVLEGAANLGPRTPAEETIVLRRKWPATTRLACQATVHGPVTVRRLVVDTRDATVADLRSTTEAQLHVEKATVLAIRIDGIEAALVDGFPDDTAHVLERCVSMLDALVGENGGRRIGLEGSMLLAAFPVDADGARRALRVALRVSARIRQINPYLLKHFGVQVGTAVGLGRGSFIEGTASIQGHSGPVLLGTALRDARRAAQWALPDQALVAPPVLEGFEDVITRPASDDLRQVVDFTKDDVVFLVQSTFDSLGQRGPLLVQRFYDELFRIHPDSVAMFAHTDMERQRRMLLDTLALAVQGLDDFARIEGAVRELGARHVGYGVTLRDYQFVGRALIAALRDTLEDAFTPEAELAWREIYSTLVRTMVEGNY